MYCRFRAARERAFVNNVPGRLPADRLATPRKAIVLALIISICRGEGRFEKATVRNSLGKMEYKGRGEIFARPLGLGLRRQRLLIKPPRFIQQYSSQRSRRRIFHVH